MTNNFWLSDRTFICQVWRTIRSICLPIRIIIFDEPINKLNMRFYSLAFSIVLSIFSIQLTAQKSVLLKIEHKLGTEDYAAGKVVNPPTNDSYDPYKINRLEYYISGINILHDNDQLVSIPDSIYIVEVGLTNQYFLGDFNLDQIKELTFSIGIDSVTNHSDPTLYPIGHPLGPRFPAMHWGWAAGYRFIAIDGRTGQNFNQFFSVHALGDAQYHSQTHTLSGTEINDTITLTLYADYTQAFDGLVVDENLFAHGEGTIGNRVLRNFQRSVFSTSPVGIKETEDLPSLLKIHPNPTTDQFEISTEGLEGYSFPINAKILDISGKEVLEFILNQSIKQKKIDVSTLSPQLYFLRMSDQEGRHFSKKLVITK